jgi:glutamate dehydrogenase
MNSSTFLNKFSENFEKSLGSLFLDFYSKGDLEFLRQEILSSYQSREKENLSIQILTPVQNDPLLRFKHRVIILSCFSMPFFAAKIKRIFEANSIPIRRNLHFHPEPGKELFYIEISDSWIERLPQLVLEIKDSHSKIYESTTAYRLFVQDRKAEWLDFQEPYREILFWLLDKAFIWEGAIYESQNGKKEFGYFSISSDIENWFNDCKKRTAIKGQNIQSRESFDTAFLNDEKLFYILLIEGHKKLLLKGSLNEFAKSSVLVDIPYYRNQFQSFLREKEIEAYSGLGRTTRMLFNCIPIEIIFLLPPDIYGKLHTSLLEHNLIGTLRSVGIAVSEEVALIVSFIPKQNWSDKKWEESDRKIAEIFPISNSRKYIVMRSNLIEGFHLIRSSKVNNQKVFELSSLIEFSFRNWEDELKVKWEENFLESYESAQLHYHDDYKSTHNPDMAIADLKTLFALKDSRVKIEINNKTDTTVIHAITPALEYPLAQWVTAITDLGLNPISERVYQFQYKGKLYAKSEFFFHFIENHKNLYKRWKKIIEYTLEGKLHSDSLSEIARWSELDGNGLLFAKAIRDYCLQTNPRFNSVEFNSHLLNHIPMVSEAWTYFFENFYLGNSYSNARLLEEADRGTTISEDEILKSFSSSVFAILRTDFFGTKSDQTIGLERNAVCFKIDSSIPNSLPEPKPYREIFVYGDRFQGIHLRGGVVARGGLRFSDRLSDYRTEVLGLLKTQNVKNTIIIPVGSKGCFVLVPNPFSKVQYEMIDAYKLYVQSLLELTDNRVEGKVVSFSGENHSIPFVKDDLDFYLVVAADKGTAGVSDIANSISEKNKYWLGDAFASGGSRGYSHKEYGITAKGALVTAGRNLRLAGKDFRKEKTTVVGIGDMGGDVFGNGLIESSQFQLIACFNHKHIFLDPNPDPEISFQERKRLFHSNLSGWDNYNLNLISKGGGLYNRNEKSIHLSEEIKMALDIQDSHLTGSQLIQAILKAKVDLLYNGGIGTYVKASYEENNKVGDPTNNDVRVNGNELRCKVVSEGGNLGFTQSGRMEFSEQGGFIFTDAIDNSAGVDLSDHEVNLKILLLDAMHRKMISNLDERDALLKKMDKEIIQSVIWNNDCQSLCINIDSFESENIGWNSFIKTVSRLTKNLILSPKQFKIPLNNEEWNLLKEKNKAIPRPILAVLLSHTKMHLYEICLKAHIFNKDKFPNLVLGYFPNEIQNHFKDSIFTHPLHNEISTTRGINTIVNILGVGIYEILGDDDVIHENIAKIYMYFEEFGINEAFSEIASIHSKELELKIIKLGSNLREIFLKNWSTSISLSKDWKKDWKSI